MANESTENRFGDLIIQAGFASREQVDECLEQKRQEEQAGKFRQLGAIMVERGLLTPDDVQLILRAQGKKVLICEGCQARYNVVGYAPEKTFRCPKCGGNLVVPAELTDVVVDRSTVTEVASAAPASLDNLEGRVISGCKVIQKIAIGGMGSIYKGRQLSMNRDIAIKVLSDELSKDRAYVQRFILEARAAGELSHTNLIHVIDVGTFEGLYYYVMEYVEGDGMDAVLERRGQLEIDEALSITLQTASALEHAHKHGIIHRDIKPDNLILMADGTVKVADLGIAKKMSIGAMGLTQPGMVLGTPFYMAPEQGKDSRLVDARSDIYALGASLYHFLTGKVPFDGKTCLEVVLKAIDSEPVPIKQLNPRLPDGVVAMVEKMMKKRPEDRYQTASDVIRDLHLIKAGVEPLLGEKAPPRPATRPVAVAAAAPPPPPTPPAAAPAPNRPVAALRPPSPAAAAPKAPAPAPARAAAAAPPRTSGTTRQQRPGAPAGAAAATGVAAARPKAARTGPPARAPLDEPPEPIRSPLNPFARAQTLPRNVLIPVVTLIGAVVLGLVGWRLLRGDSDTTHDPVVLYHPPTSVTDPVPTVAPDPQEAQEDLKKAQTYEQSHPNEMAVTVGLYQKIVDAYPSTQSAEKARQKVVDLTRKRDKALEADFTTVSTAAAEAEKSRHFAAALAALDQFIALPPTADWLAKAQNRKADLLKNAQRTFEEEEAAAANEAKAGAHQKALDRYLALKELGVPDLLARVDDRILRLEAQLEAAAAQAEATVREKFVSDPEVRALFSQRKFDHVSARLAVLEKDPKTAPAQALLALQRRIVDASAEVANGFKAGIQASVGKSDTFQIKAGKHTGSIVGTKADPKGDQLQLQIGGRVQGFELALLHVNDFLKYALLGLGTEKAEAHRQVGLFLLGQGLLAEAGNAFHKAQGLGGQVELELDYLRDLELAPRFAGWIDLAELGFARWSANENWTVRSDVGLLASSDRRGSTNLVEVPATWTSYLYTLRFKKLDGVNGLLLSFRFLGRCLTWALGEEGNTYSIVRGIPSTRTTDVVETGRWYRIRIRIVDGVATGYLNNVKKWELREADCEAAVVAEGMGVGTVTTQVQVGDPRLNPIK